MKKIMLLAATTALFASSAFAEEEQFYAKVEGGATLLQKDKISNPKTPELGSVRLKKTNTSPVMSVGVGYGLMDMVRGELEYTHYFDAENKAKTKTVKVSGADVNVSGKVKYNADIVMLKGIVDLFDAGPAKFFVGAGVGYAQLRSKANVKVDVPSAPQENKNDTFKAKKASNLAFTVLAGVAFDLSEDIKLDVSYNYVDAGKTKNYRHNNENVGSKTHFRAHTGKVGLRFAF